MCDPEIDEHDLPLQTLFCCWPTTAQVFLARGMLCFGCPIAPFHNILDACAEYRLSEAGFRAELNAALKAGPLGLAPSARASRRTSR